jgi:hypothetical protein
MSHKTAHQSSASTHLWYALGCLLILAGVSPVTPSVAVSIACVIAGNLALAINLIPKLQDHLKADRA